jgi:SsrA-binding protein
VPAYIEIVSKDEVKAIATNKKAYKDYFILETYEAGVVLTGTEVKSIRGGKVNFKDSYARLKDGEVYLLNLHISPYEQGNRYNVDPERTRKLLLHRKQIDRLFGKTQEKGLTLVPTKIYMKEGLVKVEVAVAQGKKLYDKREEIKKAEVKRDLQRMLRRKQ